MTHHFVRKWFTISFCISNSKLQHTPPGQAPGHLNFSRLACSNSLPSGQKAVQMPHQLPLLKDKFRLQSNTVHAFQREIYRNNTFKQNSHSLTKAKFYLVNPSSPAYHGRITLQYTKTRDKSGSNSAPFQGNVQIPPYPCTMHSQMPGVCPEGGRLKLRFDRYLIAWETHRAAFMLTTHTCLFRCCI